MQVSQPIILSPVLNNVFLKLQWAGPAKKAERFAFFSFVNGHDRIFDVFFIFHQHLFSEKSKILSSTSKKISILLKSGQV